MVAKWALGSWSGRACCSALALHQYDTHMKYARFNRNARSLAAAVHTLIDFKINLVYTTDLDQLHERVAKRWYDVCCQNAGLYIKIGQQVATMNHVLPAPYLKYFSTLHDQAPAVSFATVDRIVRAEFNGSGPHDIFVNFEETPVAAASIAQVHRAELSDGTKVAVKVQKPEIAAQMPWDLLCFRFLVFGFEKIFDLPMYFCVDSICEAVRQEADFRVEAGNAVLARRDLEHDQRFYVPAVHTATSTNKVLTMEWIDGIKISDLKALTAAGFDTSHAAALMVDVFSHQIFVSGFVHADPHPGNIFIRRRPNSRDTQLVLLDHGSYLSESEDFRREYCALWRAMVLLDTGAVEAICRSWGIHDSHFFASMQLLKPFTPEKHSVHLQATTKEEVLQMHTEAYDRIKQLLYDSQHVPPELILLGRNMNIVRANNKGMGSPVNRINVMARYAVAGLPLRHSTADGTGQEGGMTTVQRAEWYRDRIAHQPTHAAVDLFGNWQVVPARRRAPEDACEVFGLGGGGGRGRFHIMYPTGLTSKWESTCVDMDMLFFKSQLLAISFVYYTTQLWRSVNAFLFRRTVAGFEELLEQSINQTMEAKLGFKLNFDEGVEKCFG